MIFSSVQDAIEVAANLRPSARAFLGVGVDIGYRQLADDIELVSRFILSQGLSTGARVAIVMKPSYMHAVFILALDRLGIASLSNHFIDADILSQPWVQNLKFDCVFAVTGRPQGTEIPWVELDHREKPQDLMIAREFLITEILSDRDPARITRFIRTSGTTGTPRVVALNRDLVMKRVLAHQLFCEGMGSNRYLLGMLPGTIAGYGYLLMALCRGATVIPWLNDNAFQILIDRFHVSHLLLTPISFRNIVIGGARSERELSSVRMTTTGGAPFEARLADKARAVLGPNIWNGYTSTEAGSVARGHLSQIEADPNIIGPVLPFVNLQIVDDQDNSLPTGETGIVRVASELAVDRYESRADDDRVFRDGFVYTGDLGAVDERGFLRILGRADDLINLRGVKIMPEEIERQLATLPEIREAAVFQADAGKGLQVCAAVILEDGCTPRELSEKVKELPGTLTPQRIKVVTELPRNSMGKVIRGELANRFATNPVSHD